ncbi:MAG TPA: hypothetical protein VMJ10_15435 [Kofleriaceae bacterium]|nr:hypothetical protein [Kofleriaceae bacterium]
MRAGVFATGRVTMVLATACTTWQVSGRDLRDDGVCEVRASEELSTLGTAAIVVGCPAAFLFPGADRDWRIAAASTVGLLTCIPPLLRWSEMQAHRHHRVVEEPSSSCH